MCTLLHKTKTKYGSKIDVNVTKCADEEEVSKEKKQFSSQKQTNKTIEIVKRAKDKKKYYGKIRNGV